MPERVEPVETISASVSSGPFAASRFVATGRTNTPTHQAAYDVYQKIAVNIGKVMQGQADSTRKLLAALAEGQVSVEGERRGLAGLFFVIATQNPVEFRGTYPLPEAQMDRFAMQFALGYLQPAEEVAVLSAQELHHPLEELESCVSL